MLDHCNQVQLQIFQIAELIEDVKKPFDKLVVRVECPYCHGKMELHEADERYICLRCERSGNLNDLEDKLFDDTMRELPYPNCSE